MQPFRLSDGIKRQFAFFAFVFFQACSQSCSQNSRESYIQLPPQPGWPGEVVDRVSQQLATLPNGVEVALAKMQGDSVFFYGVTRTADTLRYINNENHVFEIGSITKVFTATLLAQLAEENRLQLTDSLAGFFSFRLKAGGAITLQQLASHTSGLPRLPSNLMPGMLLNPANPYKNYTTEKLERYLREDVKLNSPPGQNMEYSNLGVGLLGYVIARHQATSFGQLLQQRIFQPYGMNRSAVDREKVRADLVEGVSSWGNTVPYWDLMALEGAGAILSCTADLARFARAQFYASPATLRTQKKSYTLTERSGVGLGWMIRQEGDRTVIWHNGGTGGFSSCMALDLTQRRGIIVLSNYSRAASNSKNIDDLCFILLNELP